MSLVRINVNKKLARNFFLDVFRGGVHATRHRFAVRLKKTVGKNLHKIICCLLLCKLETCTYISLAAMYGLTAINISLVAG